MSKPVTARPHPGWTAFCAAGAALSLVLPLAPPRGAPDPVLWAFPVALSIATVAVALWVAGTSVRADDGGLTWRSWWRRRSVPWSGVQDYYLRPPRPNGHPSGPTYTVETTAGRISVTDAWRGGERFAAAVRLRATAAASGWQLLGTRPRDPWPRVFRYDVPRCRRTGWFFAAMGAAYAATVLGPVIARAPHYLRPSTWAMYAASSILVALMSAGMGLVCWAAAAPYRDAARRGRERIVVDPNGIMFDDGSRTVASPWSGVHQVTRVRPRRLGLTAVRRLSTDVGDIEYTPAISDVALLNAIVGQYASAARHRIIDESPEEAPGSVRVYTYRNPNVRALLIFPAGLALCFAVKGAVDAAGLSPHPSVAVDAVLAGGFAAGWLWAWWRYRTVSVRLDPLGVSWCGPGRRKRIPWAELRSARLVLEPPYRFCVVEGGRERFSFWMSITAAEELHGEIAARLAERDAVGGRARQAVR